MKTFSYNDSAGQLTEIFDYVEAHREEATITRTGHEPVVILPLFEYESLRETMYLHEFSDECLSPHGLDSSA